MRPEICQVPAASAIGQHIVDAAWFRDAYRTTLSRPDAGVVDIFFSVFGHHPVWMKRLLILRNRLAALCGLETPTDEEIMKAQRRQHYAVGDKIGPWPIFALSATELIAGRDNKHLDFRLSVLREDGGVKHSAVISTVCTTHNTFGKVYLFFVAPFHKWGVQFLIARAQAAGRL